MQRLKKLVSFTDKIPTWVIFLVIFGGYYLIDRSSRNQQTKLLLDGIQETHDQFRQNEIDLREDLNAGLETLRGDYYKMRTIIEEQDIQNQKNDEEFKDEIKLLQKLQRQQTKYFKNYSNMSDDDLLNRINNRHRRSGD